MRNTLRTATGSALFLILSATSAAQEAPTRFELPFKTGPRGHLIVDVALNGGDPLPFVLDTGAGRTVLNRARLSALGLVERPSGKILHGAHDQFDMGLTDIDSLALGDVTVESIELAVMELSGFEGSDMQVYGVLGYDLIGRWDLGLDFGAGRVAFHSRADTEASCAVCAGDIVVPFELNNGTHIQFEVVISDQPITAILDTGSGRTGMNRLTAKAIGIDLPPAQPGAHGPALQVGEVHLGDGVLARDLIVGVVDLPVFEQLGMSEGPAMLIGTGALAGKEVGVAYGLRRLSVSAEQ